MSEHRRRPHDHLVEPLIGGISDAHERSTAQLTDSRPGTRGHLVWLIIATVLAGGLFFWLR